MFFRAGGRIFDRPDGRKSLLLERLGNGMDEAVKGDAGHYVNKQTGHLIETMKNHRISPHGNSNGVVSER